MKIYTYANFSLQKQYKKLMEQGDSQAAGYTLGRSQARFNRAEKQQISDLNYQNDARFLDPNRTMTTGFMPTRPSSMPFLQKPTDIVRDKINIQNGNSRGGFHKGFKTGMQSITDERGPNDKLPIPQIW